MIQILLLFLLSFLVRLVKIQDYLFFGFEQGRDLQIVQKIYELRDFVLVGPSTSIGGVFHGVWYYYLLAIPAGLSGGNPLVISILLIFLGSLLPLVIYFLAREMFNSKSWGLVAGFVAIFSYEYILYARWLSNVSLSPLFIALAFYALWKYSKSYSGKYFVFFVLCAGIATLFQMILIVQFLLVLVVLFAFKQVKRPSLKVTALSLGTIIVLFGPMLVFNLRNQNIVFSSLVGFILNFGSGQKGGLVGSIGLYLLQMKMHLQSSVVNIEAQVIQLVVIILMFAAIFLGWKKKFKEIKYLLSWIAMSLPVIFISPGNPQYYVGVGLGWILLFVLTLKVFWEEKYLRIVAILLIGLFGIGMFSTINNLLLNRDVFFRTVQDDLNYADQRSVLEFIHSDAKGAPYRLISFTIPSLQPEAWDYLKQYFYPHDPQGGAKIVYIVIEKHVFPVWENKWINDLGKSTLVFEKKFGLLRLQKREIIE